MVTTCAACGTNNVAGSQFCSKCARKLDEATADQITRTRADSLTTQSTGMRWNAVLVAVLLALVLGAIVIGVVVVH